LASENASALLEEVFYEAKNFLDIFLL
jgi:hypothetical protein